MVMRGFHRGYWLSSSAGVAPCRERRKPPPPATDHPQEIQRYQTAGLQKMATVSVLMYGSPMDVEAALKAKAEAAKADYYVIIMIDDTMVPGQWYSQAILYRR